MSEQDDARTVAIRRLKAKRDFWNQVVTYVVVNLMIVAIWWLSGRGYFWPGWVMAGWGVGLVLQGWNVYFERPITEQDIAREMERNR